jgi:RimJ/RimL family protein N-acetyltransferase/peroxiredoxin
MSETSNVTKPRDDFYSLPENLPAPANDGACDHLTGMSLPNISLQSTGGRSIHLQELTQKLTVLFFYPRTGRPDEKAPVGWDEIPGARGCTPQSCSFRDSYAEFKKLGAEVYGVSTQTTEYQQELVARIHLPYEVLSDSGFQLTNALRLPTFEFNGMRLLKRMAWVCEGGKIVKVFYPVFPPNESAAQVLEWLKARESLALSIDENTELRLVDKNHTLEFFALIDRSRPYLREWLAWLDMTQTPTDLEKFLDRARREFEQKESYALWIRHRQQIVGIIHLREIDRANRKAMIGYWVGQEFRGRGFAKKATRAICDFGFRELKLNRIEIRCATGNTASQAVPTALGFQREGVLRQNEWLYDHYVDHVVFSMLSRDWK